MRTTSFHIRIKEWFPSEDPISVLLATLCILREDYLLELTGMIQGHDALPESKETNNGANIDLDENSIAWRRMYFYRNSLRTLYEIRKTVESAYEKPQVREALEKESSRFRDAYSELCSQMKVAADRVERIRHNLGGHISSGAIGKSLRELSHDTRGLFQDGDMKGKKRYKFVGEIVLRAMLPDTSDQQMYDKAEQLFDETEKLLSVFSLIDDVVSMYILDRGLYPQ